MLLNIVAFTTLAIGIANIIHWLARGHRLIIWPGGNLNNLFTVLYLSQLILAVAFLAGVIPAVIFITVLCGSVIIQCVYSIHYREYSDRMKANG